ncbi:MAG: hypothetical protein IKW86_11355 [Salinivirgaceae bacterium]|nr:hypothetical protein [Salinivirgaceae bacterium]
MANYSEEQIEKAWEMATIVKGYDPNMFRKDPCGAWIRRDCYNKECKYGWTIDHAIPKSLFKDNGYDSTPLNRRAMHWENNASKANDFPQYNCVVTSDGDKNVSKEMVKYINADTITELMKEVKGLDILISNQKDKWIEIYGSEQVEKWLSNPQKR